jgi:hypothetical protein
MALTITAAALAKAPSAFPKDGYKIFLGGVIDMGKGEPWHETVIQELDSFDVTILSPKRDDWDSSWEQSLQDERFVEQVEWELKAQESSDLCLYVFATSEKEAKKSKAPITLLELGLHATDNTIVCCPEGYFRKGNVDVVCRRYGIPVYNTLEELLVDLKSTLEEMGLKSRQSVPEETE